MCGVERGLFQPNLLAITSLGISTKSTHAPQGPQDRAHGKPREGHSEFGSRRLTFADTVDGSPVDADKTSQLST
jgi:hypothetical protein